MPASVDRSKFFNSWTKNPRGYGRWIFKFKPGGEDMSYTGNFGAALAKAKKYARKLKAHTIIVMP